MKTLCICLPLVLTLPECTMIGKFLTKSATLKNVTCITMLDGEWHTAVMLQPVFTSKTDSRKKTTTVEQRASPRYKPLRLIVYLARKCHERGNMSSSFFNLVPSYIGQAPIVSRLYPSMFLSWVSGSEETLQSHMKQRSHFRMVNFRL